MELNRDIWFTKASASNTPHVAQRLFEAGADGVRLTFSFGSLELQSQLSRMMRRAGKAAGKEIDVIADLPGEQIRIADLGHHDRLDIPEGDMVELSGPEESFSETKMRIPVDSEELVEKVSEGEKIYIGDGDVILEVLSAGETLKCRVESSGTINPRRGIQPQSQNFEPEALTEKDLERLKYVAETGDFDSVLLSFVSEPEEVRKAKEAMETAGDQVPVIAKIETGKGVENAEKIAEVSDAVMVARGDLALLEPWEELAENCEKVVKAAEKTNTEWIMATQLLEGLEHFSVPLRPEICDIQRWRERGADAFMLCHETAFGSDPENAVEKLSRIINDPKDETE